jgi:hypothetical protein
MFQIFIALWIKLYNDFSNYIVLFYRCYNKKFEIQVMAWRVISPKQDVCLYWDIIKASCLSVCQLKFIHRMCKWHSTWIGVRPGSNPRPNELLYQSRAQVNCNTIPCRCYNKEYCNTVLNFSLCPNKALGLAESGVQMDICMSVYALYLQERNCSNFQVQLWSRELQSTRIFLKHIVPLAVRLELLPAWTRHPCFRSMHTLTCGPLRPSALSPWEARRSILVYACFWNTYG